MFTVARVVLTPPVRDVATCGSGSVYRRFEEAPTFSHPNIVLVVVLAAYCIISVHIQALEAVCVEHPQGSYPQGVAGHRSDGRDVMIKF